MDGAEFDAVSARIAAVGRCTVSLGADIIDAIDPAVTPMERFKAVERAFAAYPLRALLYATTIACGQITTRFEHDPNGQAAYMRQLRGYIATGTTSDEPS